MELPVQSIQYSAFEVDDFSGGITDNYIGGDTTKYRIADNLVLEKYGDRAKLKLRAGSEFFDVLEPVVLNPERISALKYFGGAILVWATNKVFYQNTAGTWTNLVGPNGGNSVFLTASDSTNIVSIAASHDHLLVANDNYEYISKIYKNSAGAYQIRTAGLPDLASSPSLASFSAGANSFLYRFCHKYTYLVGTVQYIDRGPLTEVSLSSAGTVSTANPVNITSIPVLSNTANHTLWDTTNIDIEIYRTTNAGVNFFLAKTIDNGTTSTSDTMIDATLQLQEPLYTEGGIVENDPVPKAQVVHICEDTAIAYYGSIKDGTELKTSLIRQSIPGDLDSCPADFELEINDTVVGISSIQDRVIVCGQQNTYRIDGAFDLLGRGGMLAQKISDRSDCVSSQSVVQTLVGTFWCGADNFYWTNGYQVLPINLEWTKTHRTFTNTAAKRKKIQGKYDRAHNRIWWVVQIGSYTATWGNPEDPFTNVVTSSDNDIAFILHLNFSDPASNRWVFTTASGRGAYNDIRFSPAAIEFVDSTMYRGTDFGRLMIHRDTLLTDVRPTTGFIETPTPSMAIKYTYESVSFNMGFPSLRKICPRISIRAARERDTANDLVLFSPIGITSINDLSKETLVKPINLGNNAIVFSDYAPEGIVSEQRRFKGSAFRFTEKQVRFSNAWTVIATSDQYVRASVDPDHTSGDGFVSFQTTSADITNWLDYGISFSTDNFTKEYAIIQGGSYNTAGTAFSYLLRDSAGTLPDTSPDSASNLLEWVVRGYLKEASFNLISYTADYAPLGKTQHSYKKNQTGELT